MDMIFIITLSFIVGSLITLLFIDKKVIKNISESKNHVHFYVARNKSFNLYLFIGKPVRCEDYWGCSKRIAFQNEFNRLNLNVEDFKDLKWEDEPVEVFIKMED